MSDVLPTLAVTADLRLAVDGHDVRITGAKQHLLIELPSLRAGAVLLRSGPFHTRRAQRLRDIHQALRAAGLTAEIRVAGKTLARLGSQARSGALPRLVRLDGMDTRPAGSLRRLSALGLSLLAGVAALGWYLNRKD